MKKITEEFLKKQDACMEGIEFFKRNKLYLFNFDYVKEIEGDYNNYFNWIKDKLYKYKYDKNNNMIEHKGSNKYIKTWRYDKRGNMIEQKDSNGYIDSWKYDKNNNIVEYKDCNGYTYNYKYDRNNTLIERKSSDGDIEYISNHKHNKNNNGIEYKSSDGDMEKLECKHNNQGMLLQIKKDNKIILSIPNKMIKK